LPIDFSESLTIQHFIRNTWLFSIFSRCLSFSSTCPR